MNPKPLSDSEWFELVLGEVIRHQERILQPPQPMTEHEGLTPVGMSQMHPFERDFQGKPRDVSIHAREDL